MPELPEVETVREGVHHHAVGCVIERVRILDERSIRRHIGGSADFTLRLEGTRIRGAYRRGEYMWLTLSAPEDEPFPKRGDSDDTLLPYALVIHLGMSGQLLVKTPEFPAEKHLKIVLELEPADGESTNKATELR
ncbi:MAG: DNA-formamidopyrimidine glycosylase family protein, partial [Rothia dentocariosa]